MPRIVKFWSLYFSTSSMKIGISCLHGAHHVAQKLTMTGRPLKSSRRTSFPFMSLRAKSNRAYSTGPAGFDEQPGHEAMAAAQAAAAAQRPIQNFRDVR